MKNWLIEFLHFSRIMSLCVFVFGCVLTLLALFSGQGEVADSLLFPTACVAAEYLLLDWFLPREDDDVRS